MASKSSTTTTISTSNYAISASIVATTDRDTKQILLTASIPLCVCLIGLLLVGLFKQRRSKLRNSKSQRMEATKEESSVIRRKSLSLIKKETFARDVEDRYADHEYNHTENRNSNYINSTMIQYTICTEVNMDKRDIPVDTYDRYVTESEVSHLETTSQGAVSREKYRSNDGETDGNYLNNQYQPQQLETKDTVSSECAKSNNSETGGNYLNIQCHSQQLEATATVSSEGDRSNNSETGGNYFNNQCQPQQLEAKDTISSEFAKSYESETGGNYLNTQCHSQQLEAKATVSSEGDRSNNSETEGNYLNTQRHSQQLEVSGCEVTTHYQSLRDVTYYFKLPSSQQDNIHTYEKVIQ